MSCIEQGPLWSGVELLLQCQLASHRGKVLVRHFACRWPYVAFVVLWNSSPAKLACRVWPATFPEVLWRQQGVFNDINLRLHLINLLIINRVSSKQYLDTATSGVITTTSCADNPDNTGHIRPVDPESNMSKSKRIIIALIYLSFILIHKVQIKCIMALYSHIHVCAINPKVNISG